MMDEFMMNKLIKLLDKAVQEFKDENASDCEFNQDEVLDITTGVTDCDGCNSNSVWGYVRGLEEAKDLIRLQRV